MIKFDTAELRDSWFKNAEGQRVNITDENVSSLFSKISAVLPLSDGSKT